MSKVAIVNKNDEVIGAMDRTEALEQEAIRRLIHIIILTPENKVLLQQRSLTVHNPLKWTLSASGHVDEGEDYEDAAIRETKEEIGLDIKPEDLEFLFHNYLETESTPTKKAKAFSKAYILRTDLKVGEINFDKNDIFQIKYFTIQEIKSLLVNNEGNFTNGCINVLNYLIKYLERK